MEVVIVVPVNSDGTKILGVVSGAVSVWSPVTNVDLDLTAYVPG